MSKAKKKLSKKAKEALKVLEESKLLQNSNAIAGGKPDPGFKQTSPSFQNKKAHKARPNKKRG